MRVYKHMLPKKYDNLCLEQIKKLLTAPNGLPYPVKIEDGIVRGLYGEVPSPVTEESESEDTFYFMTNIEKYIRLTDEYQAQPKKKRPKRPAKTTTDARRKKEISKIHIAKKELGLDETTYRVMLREFGGASSAKNLTAEGRQAVLDHLRSCGWKSKPGKKPYPGQPDNMNDPNKGPLLRKISALLADNKLPWAYADGIAKRMFKIKKVGDCSPSQLHKIVSALSNMARKKK